MGQIIPFRKLEPENDFNEDFDQTLRDQIERAQSHSARRALARIDQALIEMNSCQQFRDLLDVYSMPIIVLATIAVFTLAMSFRMEAMMSVYVASHIGTLQALLDGAGAAILPSLFAFIIGIFINGALHEHAQRRYNYAVDHIKIPAENRFRQLTGVLASTYDSHERQLSYARQSVKGEKEIQRSAISKAKHLHRNIHRRSKRH